MPGQPQASDGVIKANIEKNKVYRLCFTSTDSLKKMVAFEYVQTHRRKTYSKGEC